MTNVSGYMAETSVADFFIAKIWSGERSPMFGPDHASKVVGFRPMDRVEIDAYDNGHRLIWPTLYVQK